MKQKFDTSYPTTMENFLASEWVSIVKSIIHKFNLNEDEEDVFQDVISLMLTRNYLGRWDGSKGSYFSWVYTFVFNLCCQKFNRSNTKPGRAIEGAVRLDQFINNENEEEVLGICIQKHPVAVDFFLRIEEIIKILSDKQFEAHTYTVYQGKELPRSPRKVFELVVFDNLTPREVAEIMNTSLTWVYNQLKCIRSIVDDIIGD